MTGDRVAEIRARDAAASVKMTNAKWTMHDGLQAVSDRRTLLAEVARLRAQLDTVWGLADSAPLVPVHAGGGNLVNSKRMVSADNLRAALNQGGEHV